MDFDYIQNLVDDASGRINQEKVEREQYWNEWLDKQKKFLESKEEVDTLQKNLVDLMEVAINLRQYERPENENDEVSRVIKFSIRGLSKEIIENIFDIKTYSLKGCGLYTVMEGLLLTRETRERTGFDTKGIHRYYDLSMFTKEQQETYNFSLSIPAMGGLFIPKRTRLIGWISRRFQLQYFDIESI